MNIVHNMLDNRVFIMSGGVTLVEFTLDDFIPKPIYSLIKNDDKSFDVLHQVCSKGSTIYVSSCLFTKESETIKRSYIKILVDYLFTLKYYNVVFLIPEALEDKFGGLDSVSNFAIEKHNHSILVCS